MSGRSSISYRALSRCLVSLASAGSVCCAKPNHGFSGCQQATVTFSRRPPRTRKRAALPLHHAYDSHYPPHGHFANTGIATGLCFQCLQGIGQLLATLLLGYFFATPVAGGLPAGIPEAAVANTGTHAGFRGAQAVLRENCAGIGRGRSTPARVPDGAMHASLHAMHPRLHRPAPPKKNRPHWAAGRGSIRKHELSDRLPRAVRHSRPGRAVP